MSLPLLSHLSHQELLGAMRAFRETERAATADIVLYLHEIDTRGIYRDYGYSSLWAYCTEGLGYSAMETQRRVSVARCLAEHPEIYEKLKTGKLTMCSVACVARVEQPEQREALLVESEGLSRQEVERLVAPLLPPREVRAGTIKPVALKNPSPSLEVPLVFS